MELHGLTSYHRDELIMQSVEIAKDPIAIAVCRIMQDFRSVKEIVLSLVHDANEERLSRYLACSLASYCYKGGISYSILTSAFEAAGLSKQFSERDMLPLSFVDPDSRDYVVPTNPVLSERVLREVSNSDTDLIFEVCCALGANLAPYVNRSTIVRRTPEARVAARLLDYDDVVVEFISSRSEEFYLRMKNSWDWNSRYWEQFALLKLDKFLKSNDQHRLDYLTQAISHARHAVQLERHPLGLTTLGRILLEEMRHNPARAAGAFDEAFAYLDKAISQEGQLNRIAIHPYTTLFNGANIYLKLPATPSAKQADALRKHMDNAEKFFNYDEKLLILIRELSGRLGPQKG